jgi:hypothetical protein
MPGLFHQGVDSDGLFLGGENGCEGKEKQKRTQHVLILAGRWH